MSFVLEVDTDAWRAHLRSYLAATPGLVPVVKGNGYGFGRGVLYAAAAELGLDTIATGTYAEAAEALAFGAFSTISVLEPWRPEVDLGSASPAAHDRRRYRRRSDDPPTLHRPIHRSSADHSAADHPSPGRTTAEHPASRHAASVPSSPVHSSMAQPLADPVDHRQRCDDRLLHTVSRGVDVAPLSALAADGRPVRVAIEVLTSMRRHGVRANEVAGLAAELASASGLDVEAVAMHLPIDRPHRAKPAREVSAWLARLASVGIRADSVLVSHLTAAELARLSTELAPTRMRPRVGTALWLGAESALRARARVVDVHSVRRGERSGYRQRRVPADGSLVVVSGGTSHGIGLDAVSAPRGTARARQLAVAGLEAMGPRLSPFHWRGSQRWYAEPPHMQLSTLFLPATVVPPEVGDWLDVDCRKTTTIFDEVVFR